MKAIEYANDATNYLPVEIADFHDQKDMFKLMVDVYGGHDSYKTLANNWVQNHVFTIDFLLYFFALHGYKLQKVRKKNVEFLELSASLNDFHKRQLDSLSQIFANTANKPAPQS